MGNTVARSESLHETWQYLCSCWDNQAVHCKLSDQEAADVLRDLRIFIDNELGASKMTDRLWYTYENQSHQKFVIRLQEQCSLILELIYQLRLSILEVKLQSVGGKGLPLPADLKHTTTFNVNEPEEIFELDSKLSAQPKMVSAPEDDRVRVMRGLALSELATIYHSLRSDINATFQVISNSERVQVMTVEGYVEEHPQQTYFDQATRTHLLRLGLMKPGDDLSQTQFYTAYLPVAIQAIFEIFSTIRPGAPRPYPSILPSYQPALSGYTNNASMLKDLSYEDRSLVHSFLSSSTAKHIQPDPISSLPLLSSAPPFLHSPISAPGEYCYNLQVALSNVVPETMVRLDHRIAPLVLDLSTSLLRIAHTQYSHIKRERIRQATRPILNDINSVMPTVHKYPANLFMMVSACISTAGGKREWWSVTEPKPLASTAKFDIPLLTKYLPSTSNKEHGDIRHVLSKDNDVVSTIDALSLLNTNADADKDSKKKEEAANVYVSSNPEDDAPALLTDTEMYQSICSPTIRIVVHVLRLTTRSMARQRALPHNQQVHPLTALALNPDGTAYMRDDNNDKDAVAGVAVDELDSSSGEELCMEIVGTLGGVSDLNLATIMNSHTIVQHEGSSLVFAPMRVPVTQLNTHLDPSDHENPLISMDNSAPTAVNTTCDIVLTPISIPTEAADHNIGSKQQESAIYTSAIHINHVAGLCASGNNGYMVIPHAVMALHRSLCYTSEVLNHVFQEAAAAQGNTLMAAVSECITTVYGDWEGVCWLSFLLHHMITLLESCKKRLAVYDLLSPGSLARKHVSPHNLKAVNRLHKSLKNFMTRIDEDIEDFGKASVTLVLGGDHSIDVVDPDSAEVVYKIKEWGQRKSGILQARSMAASERRDFENIIDTSDPTPFDPAEDVLISFLPHPCPDKLHYYDRIPNKDMLYKDPFKLYSHTTDSTGALPALEYQQPGGVDDLLKKRTEVKEEKVEEEDKKSFLGNMLSFGFFGKKSAESEVKEEVKSDAIAKEKKQTVDYSKKKYAEATPHPGISYWPYPHPIPESVQQLFAEKPIPACPAPPEPVDILSPKELIQLSSSERAEYERKREIMENYPWLLEQWKRAIEREESVVPGHVMRGISYDPKEDKVTLIRDRFDDIHADTEDIINYQLALESTTAVANMVDVVADEEETVVKKAKPSKKSRNIDVRMALKARKQAQKEKEKLSKFICNIWGASVPKQSAAKSKEDIVISGDDDLMLMLNNASNFASGAKSTVADSVTGTKSLQKQSIDYHTGIYKTLNVLDPVEPSVRSTVPFAATTTLISATAKANANNFAYTYPTADENLLKKAAKKNLRAKAKARAKAKKKTPPVSAGSMAADAFSPLHRSTSVSPSRARAETTGRRSTTPAAGLLRRADKDDDASGKGRFGRVDLGYGDDDDSGLLRGMDSLGNTTSEESVAVDFDGDNFDKLLETAPDNDVLSDASSLGILENPGRKAVPAKPPRPGMGPRNPNGSPSRVPHPIPGKPGRPGIPPGKNPSQLPRGPRPTSNSADGRAGSPQPRFSPNNSAARARPAHPPHPHAPHAPHGPRGPRGPPQRMGSPQRPGSVPRSPARPPPGVPVRTGSQPRDASDDGRSQSRDRPGAPRGRPAVPRPVPSGNGPVGPRPPVAGAPPVARQPSDPLATVPRPVPAHPRTAQGRSAPAGPKQALPAPPVPATNAAPASAQAQTVEMAHASTAVAVALAPPAAPQPVASKPPAVPAASADCDDGYEDGRPALPRQATPAPPRGRGGEPRRRGRSESRDRDSASDEETGEATGNDGDECVIM